MKEFDLIEKRLSPYGLRIDLATLPTVLYHYTDASGLLGMLNAHSIWATEYRYLNDRSEVDHTHALVDDILTKRMSSSSDALLSRFYLAAKAELSNPRDEERVFFFSLSEERDSLSQWRGYARDGCGFTLGFDARTLCATSEDDEGIFGICKVEYDLDKQRKGMAVALDALEVALKKLTAKKKPEVIDRIVRAAARSFEVIVWNRAVANKHASFSSENEWRLFFFTDRDSLSRVKVRSRSAQLIPYIEFSAEELSGKDSALPLIEIGIGPGFSDQGQTLPVASLCRQHGYDVPSYFASAPYRSG